MAVLSFIDLPNWVARFSKLSIWMNDVVNTVIEFALVNRFESGYFRSTNYSSSRTLCFTVTLHKYIDRHDEMSQFDNDLGEVVFCGKRGGFLGVVFRNKNVNH